MVEAISVFLNTAMICLIGEIKATEFSLLLHKNYVHLAHFQAGVDFSLWIFNK